MLKKGEGEIKKDVEGKVKIIEGGKNLNLWEGDVGKKLNREVDGGKGKWKKR